MAYSTQMYQMPASTGNNQQQSGGCPEDCFLMLGSDKGQLAYHPYNNCLSYFPQNAQNQGQNAGYQQGQNAGYQQGQNAGYQQGQNAGYQQGQNPGGYGGAPQPTKAANKSTYHCPSTNRPLCPSTPATHGARGDQNRAPSPTRADNRDVRRGPRPTRADNTDNQGGGGGGQPQDNQYGYKLIECVKGKLIPLKAMWQQMWDHHHSLLEECYDMFKGQGTPQETELIRKFANCFNEKLQPMGKAWEQLLDVYINKLDKCLIEIPPPKPGPKPDPEPEPEPEPEPPIIVEPIGPDVPCPEVVKCFLQKLSYLDKLWNEMWALHQNYMNECKAAYCGQGANPAEALEAARSICRCYDEKISPLGASWKQAMRFVIQSFKECYETLQGPSTTKGGQQNVIRGGQQGIIQGGQSGVVKGGQSGIMQGGQKGVIIQGGRSGVVQGGQSGVNQGGQSGVISGRGEIVGFVPHGPGPVAPRPTSASPHYGGINTTAPLMPSGQGFSQNPGGPSCTTEMVSLFDELEGGAFREFKLYNKQKEHLKSSMAAVGNKIEDVEDHDEDDKRETKKGTKG